MTSDWRTGEPDPTLGRECTEVEPTYWERVALTRWGSYLSGVERRAILEGQGRFQAPTAALDVGCEGGRWSRLLAERGWSMTCLDVDAGTLRACHLRLPQATCHLVGREDSRLPVEDCSQDLVLCMQVPPVVQSDWFPLEAWRVLRPGGVIVGVFFNGWSVRGLAGRLKAAFLGGYRYYRLAYLPWRSRLRAQGFDFGHEEGYCWFPIPRTCDGWYVPWVVRLERLLGLPRLVGLSPWVVFVAIKRLEKAQPN